MIMPSIRQLISRTLRTAAPVSVATTAAVAFCGQAEDGNPVAPLNAVSHIVWGDEAADRGDASIDHTLLGIGLNTVAVTSWSAVYELFFGEPARRGNLGAAVFGGMATAGLAYVTDYYVVPKRLTPGFEKRLSPESMLLVYSTLALSLPIVSIIDHHVGDTGK